jgi:Tfp pilus assembly protein PilX
MDRKESLIFGNQSGSALVIALIMMIVLTVVALASSLTSIFDIKLSGNKRGMTDAFYVADGGVQAVLPRVANFHIDSSYTAVNDIGTLPEALQTERIDKKKTMTSAEVSASLPSGVNFTDPPDIVIYHTSMTGAPKGTGFSATGSFEYQYFIIDSIGRDQLDASLIMSNKSRCEVRQKVVRLIPTAQGGN